MLRVSEHFYSIQGEGVSVGVPAYFIRLQNCNLMCGGHNAALVKEGKATWWCDSERIWREGTDITSEQLEKILEEKNLLLNTTGILSGITHIVWTGGEPTLLRNQIAIADFINYINKKYYPNSCLFNEIETNGTIVTEKGFYSLIDQINCSPKLANSGMSESMRIIPEAIKQILEHKNSYFKFVVSTEEDIKEIQNTFIIPFKIPEYKIVIMPGVDNRKDLPERTAFLFEMTKKYGYRGITRQHILAYDKTCGV